MTTAYFQMAAALLFVIILIAGAGYLLRKKQNRLGLMDVVSYQSLGPKKGVAALKIGEEVLILGITTNDMRLLKTFKESELDLPEKSGFSEKLDNFKRAGAGRN